MRVSLNSELERFVHDQVKRGQYPTPSDVVRGALEVLKEQDEWIAQHADQLRAAVKVGLDELDRGQGEPWDPAKIKAEGRRILAARAKRTSRSPARKRKSA